MSSFCDLIAWKNEKISPFQRNIVLGYYDAPTESISDISGRVVYIRMIAWDENQDLRCYAIDEISKISFSELEKAFSILGQPSYPDWILHWRFKDKKEEKKLAAVVAKVRKASIGTKWIMLGHSLSSKVKIRNVGKEMLKAIPPDVYDGHYSNIDEWLKYFTI